MNDTNEVRMTLRLPVAIRDRLIQTAEMNNRSMNGEIVERLDYSLYRLHDDFQRVIDDTHRDDVLRFEAEKNAMEDELRRANKRIEELEESLVKDRAALRELTRVKQELAMANEHNALFTEVLNRLTSIERIIQKPKD